MTFNTDFGDGEDAYESLIGFRFDLLLTDFNMPALSGLAVAREAKALRPDLPVLIASGYITKELEHEAQLLKAQADLRAVLTVRQEAIIVMAGLLPP